MFVSLCLLANHKKIIKETKPPPHDKQKPQIPQIQRLISLRKKFKLCERQEGIQATIKNCLNNPETMKFSIRVSDVIAYNPPQFLMKCQSVVHSHLKELDTGV